MSQKFQASIHHRDDLTFVKLTGVIDEDNDLGELTEKIHGSTVVIDLAEVDRINSCGVRDWVNWLGRVEAKRVDVVLVECSPAIVAQINLVNNFTATGVVKSFYVPYFCPECDEEKVLLCETAEMGAPPHEPPICRCDECDLVMDFDDMPDSYFAFLANQRRVGKPERIQSVLDEFNSGDEEKSKIRSRVGSGTLVGANLSSQSLPTVPSLPSISRSTLSGITPGSIHSASSFNHVASQPGLNPGLRPGLSTSGGLGLSQELRGDAMVARSSPLVYALVAILLVAIAVLAVLLLRN